MTGFKKVAAAALLIAAASVSSGARSGQQTDARAKAPSRIISLVPAVTEMLFAVGAGPRVVGVSSFDHFPKEVERLPRVGALLDPDVERILSLRPDLVVVYRSQTDVLAQLGRAYHFGRNRTKAARHCPAGPQVAIGCRANLHSSATPCRRRFSARMRWDNRSPVPPREDRAAGTTDVTTCPPFAASRRDVVLAISVCVAGRPSSPDQSVSAAIA